MGITDLIEKLDSVPFGFSRGTYAGNPYGMTKSVSADGKRLSFFAEELGGRDHVSFNLYQTTAQGWILKPCEMSSDKIYEFIGEVALVDSDESTKML